MGVVALSVVSLVGHFAIALTLIAGTVHSRAQVAPVAAAAGTGSGAGAHPIAPATGSQSSLHLDHACLIADNAPTKAAIPAGDPFGTDVSDLGDKAELQRLYAVQGTDLVPLDGAGPVRECDQQLWRVVTAAAPPSVLGYLKEFLVFDADLGGSYSGTYVGEVTPAGNDSTKDAAKWRMSLAPNGATDLDVAVTVAHEIGHLVSLNATELAAPQPSDCTTFDAGEGCLADSAYLLGFLDETWSDTEVDDWTAASDISDQDKRDTALTDFYNKHHTSFVDSYAATDPTEDFAESFGIWCAIDQDNPVLPQLIQRDPTDGKGKLAWFDTTSSIVRDFAEPCRQLRALTR